MTSATEMTPPRPLRRRSSTSVRRRNALVTQHYACIEKVAKTLMRRLPSSTDVSELRSAGALGLIEAATRFDPARGDSFEAFARIRIRGAMLDDIRLRDTMSRDMRRAWRAIARSQMMLTQRLGRPPTEVELADDLGLSLEALRTRRAQLSGALVIGIDDAGADLLERTPDMNADDPQEVVARRELLDRLAGHVSALPERMQQVLGLYYRENLSLKEIGVVLGVTECRVCQIHGEATRRLRDAHGEGRFGREAA